MDIKYNVSKIKGSKEEIVKDAVSVEEPLEMRLKSVSYTHLTLPTKA